MIHQKTLKVCTIAKQATLRYTMSWIEFGRSSRGGKKNVCQKQVKRLLSKLWHKQSLITSWVATNCLRGFATQLNLCWQSSGGDLLKTRGKLIGWAGTWCQKLRIKEVWGLEVSAVSTKLSWENTVGDKWPKGDLSWKESLRVDTILEAHSWMQKKGINLAMPGEISSVIKKQ